MPDNEHQQPPSTLNRRLFIGGSSALLAGGMLGSRLNGQEVEATEESGGEKSPAELVDDRTQRAIDRGLTFLARRQIKTGINRGAFGTSGYPCGVAVGALGGLAMMCGGSAPAEGKYGGEVERCVEFVLSQVRESGYIARRDNAANENMYGHGFAMLFLAEAYGMTRKAEIGEKLRRAVTLTINSQNTRGGWRYQPTPEQTADLSITVCQIMGLRAARDAGIHVPDEVRELCIDYVKKSQNDNGSFRYQLRGGHSTFAMTAAGVTSLYSAGIYDSDQVKKGLDHLMQHLPGGAGSGGHYFYAHYYAVQAMWHAGGDYWNRWYPAIRDELVSRQSADGSWPSSMAGPEFGAAMACIILQMPLNFLPVFSP
ncbi:MAG: prenyltransferase/squalene oxidase repeat-containing protein [Pirellulaceae bacterium]